MSSRAAHIQTRVRRCGSKYLLASMRLYAKWYPRRLNASPAFTICGLPPPRVRFNKPPTFPQITICGRTACT